MYRAPGAAYPSMCEAHHFDASYARVTKVGPPYRGTSLIRKRNPLGPYSTPVPGDLLWS